MISYKMGKRTRESSISIKETFDNHVVIEWNGKQYAIFNIEEKFLRLFDMPDYTCEIIHNFENRAMINIENIRTGDIILRQEVNPAKFKYTDEWVEDVQ
jgi:hypothetical protein